MAKTVQNTKLTYVALGIAIVALIVAIFGLIPSKKPFGPAHHFKPGGIEQQAHFRDKHPTQNAQRPQRDMRQNVQPGQPGTRPDAQRQQPGVRPDVKRPTPTQGK